MQKEEIISVLADGIAACEKCATNCISDKKAIPDEVITQIRDCTDACFITAKYLARNSVYSDKVTRMCIQVCKDLERTCSVVNDKDFKNCSVAARRCYIVLELNQAVIA